jgi:hypothetical protein
MPRSFIFSEAKLQTPNGQAGNQLKHTQKIEAIQFILKITLA